MSPSSRTNAAHPRADGGRDPRFLLGQLAGIVSRSRHLELPLAFVELTRGNHRAALFLQACLEHSAASQDPEGWFAHSYPEWEAELRLPKSTVRRLCAALAPWLRTEVHQIENGETRVHYRIDAPALLDALRQASDQPARPAPERDARPQTGD